MARPRVFISSTHYDLKHVRASLDLFVGSLGFEAVLSEKGSIAYAHDRPLDESCYREAEGADIFVMLIGGRYGSRESGGERLENPDFYLRYNSITRGEFEHARRRNVPTYVAIEKGVLSEFGVFRLNRDRADVAYAHVDSVNVFHLVEHVMSQSRVAVLPFDRFEEIQSWLREQWAGNYRDLLRRQTELGQISSLAAQIGELKEVSETLKKYMEAVLQGADPKQSATLIAEEDQRLEELRRQELLRSNGWTQFMARTSVPFADYYQALQQASSANEFLRLLRAGGLGEGAEQLVRHMFTLAWVQNEIDEARKVLGLPRFTDFEDAAAQPRRYENAKRAVSRRDGERRASPRPADGPGELAD
ncbi:MAG: hypothetical protein BGP24_15010 [Lysobacterales bacterium 69-70]|nr:DUF4062 domain-containing protein [Xanthomonadaceae bacterium]ODU35391.1 MAG: hypothetical protein ABS97_05835 [Xanthomonadaceae bacterium SCN 69-320]ODV16844.1 MAG: hypothetical protein ABT27_18880 [Xanthomonadaceae bacterium SCN 69-25]OJY94286.1 MAG: hypothetical protein BGP24_15010 [Xanthomonadales bacterium 69-70]